ncbi:MAG: glycosyltransferase family 2 protein [Gammaproteobacteria bacterium]|nr:glycosyltransferase family 2 protein [Gammaproteobacteria bacterium]
MMATIQECDVVDNAGNSGGTKNKGIHANLSVVVPLYNEEESVGPLIERMNECLATYSQPWELILVDDGSSDATVATARRFLEHEQGHIRLLELQRNFGQTAAMQAGIDAARGEVIVTLDGDLQNDPIDIPRMVERLLREDLDLLSGWRKDRQDNMLMRKIPSRIANKLIGKITGVRLHDYGCSLKVYRARVIKSVRLYGEMHRFIPAWVASNTSPSRIKEEVVTHHARQFGESKYGISRTYRVLLDLLFVYFFMRFRARPGHFFGRIGLAMGALGGAMLTYLALAKILFGQDIGSRPLLLLGVLLVVVSIQFFTTGIMSEMITRTYYESSDRKPYVVTEDSQTRDADRLAWKMPDSDA